MGILIDKNTKVLIQGMTGAEGSKAAKEMLDYGVQVICGVTPGKGGQKVEGKPIFDTVKEAKSVYPKINTSVVYVPPIAAKDACLEAIANGIKLIVCITENVPIHDTAKIIAFAKSKGARVIGPSSIGVINPSVCKLGSIGGSKSEQFVEGKVGFISKSGGMLSETAFMLKEEGIGISTAVGIGGDVISGSDFSDILKLFEKDPKTVAVLIYGEIGGEYEQNVANLVASGEFTKPLVAFVAGKFAESLPQTTLGHAGAIIEGESSSRAAKVKALELVGVKVAKVHHELVKMIEEVL